MNFQIEIEDLLSIYSLFEAHLNTLPDFFLSKHFVCVIYFLKETNLTDSSTPGKRGIAAG